MTSRFYRYADIIKRDTSYARRMTRLSNSIFGESTRPVSQKSTKVVRILSSIPHDKKFQYTHWYPRHVETAKLTGKLRDYGLFRDEHQDFKDELDRLRELRGKNWMKNTLIKAGKLKPNE